MRKLLTAVALAVGLAACGGPKITTGTVYQKRYEPPYTTLIWIPIQTSSICSGSGSTQSCTPIYTPMPFVWYDGPDWVVSIDGKDKHGKEVSQDFYVDESDYGDYHVGQYVDFGKDKSAHHDDFDNRKTAKG